MKKKVAIINQRYGVEVNGGSEQHTRQLAEKLISHYDIEILTTCALEYTTWENFFPEGLQIINRVPVRRFPVDKPRNMRRFNEISARVLTGGGSSEDDVWIDEQGPLCTKLINFLREHREEYDCFIFVTYLYYLTVCGIDLVKDKAILVPTAHNEPSIRLAIYKKVFAAPRAIAFNTEEERKFVHSLFRNQHIPGDILGVGVDLPGNINPGEFKKKYKVDNYLVYVGRIDEGKGCPELFNYFIRYKKNNPSDIKLLLIGKSVMQIPQNPDILPIGFVSEEDKYNGIAASKILILPSVYESLSMVVLESLALGIPVIVNGNCDVLRGHCLKSNAGLYYRTYYEFEAAINYLLLHPKEYTSMRLNGQRYIKENYDWDVIIGKLEKMIDRIYV
jgi:glycosyltransferase involved in cell wall biosynthesis